ncbi:hypothetical protein C8Q80DRAFT_1093460 [Daedaleopsis nitida]|nr:hypothetical protein C8Q80DRAFT_1093460 [Daedaleopsis nitida]
MSSPTSETAPSPPPEVPSVALAPLALPPTSLDPPLLSTATEFQSLPRDTAPPDTVVDPPPSDAAVTPVPPSPSVEPTAANTPDPQLPTPSATVSREVSVQLSPRITAVAKLARPHVEAGELSPPGSDKTLQGEAEIVEKDHDVRSQKDTAALMSQEVAMDVDQAPSDKVFAEIPLSDALRMVAKLRFRHDPVTQDARIEPILISNRQLAEPEPEPEQRQQPEQGQQQQQEEKEQEYAGGHYDGTKHSLRKRFAQRQVALAEKVSRLRKEYLALHERWLVHCAKLDEIARASALEEVAATACRTTRRTTAMGDAVRSDLEMEQILASLGNEELTDANHLSAKNAAVIPDMVSVTKGRVEYIYDDTNNLVEDPHDFYKLDTGIDDWTEEEKIILLEKYAIHPKQFGIIAKFIPNKTPSQCVTFYYLHKNTTIDFRKVIAQFSTIGKRRRSGRGKQKGNALLADILKHDDEVGREGTPSSGRRKRGGPSSSTPVPPSASTDSIDETKRATGSVSTGSVSRRGTAQNTPDPTPTPDPEAAPSTSAKRPRRRANPSAKAAAAMDQDGAPEEAPEEDARPTKRTRKARKSKPEVDDEDDAPITPSDTKPAEQPDPPVRKRVPGSGSSWSAEDKALFLKLLAQYGDDFKRIASSMPNKTTIQVSAFYRANLTEMQLAKVAALAPKRSPTPHDNNHARLNSTIPGTGMMTSVMKRTNPGIDNGAATLSSRSSGRMSPPPNPSGTQSSETDKRATSAAPRNSAASSKSGLPSQPLSYQGGLAAAFAGPARSTFADPHTAQMTYPSAMAYANLGPSSFASSRAAALPRGINPARLPGATVPPVMDYSEFAPRPWQPPPVRQRPGQMHPSAVLGIGAPVTSGLPATLETTEDLVRYLEHRTRLSAGQTSDNDFML